MFLTEDLSTQTGTFALVPLSRGGRRAGGRRRRYRRREGVAAALRLGAVGRAGGNRVSPLSGVHHECGSRAALASDAARHDSPDEHLHRAPGEGIVNRAIRELGPISDLAPAFPGATTTMDPLRVAAEKRGSGRILASLVRAEPGLRRPPCRRAHPQARGGAELARGPLHAAITVPSRRSDIESAPNGIRTRAATLKGW